MNEMQAESGSILPNPIAKPQPHYDEPKVQPYNGYNNSNHDRDTPLTLLQSFSSGNSVTASLNESKKADRNTSSSSSCCSSSSGYYSHTSPKLEELRNHRDLKLDILEGKLQSSSHSVFVTPDSRRSPRSSVSTSPEVQLRPYSFEQSSEPLAHLTLPSPDDMVGLSRVEQIRARRQQKLDESKQNILGISIGSSFVASSPERSVRSSAQVSPPQSPDTESLRSMHQQMIDGIDEQINSIPKPSSRALRIGMDGSVHGITSSNRKERKQFGIDQNQEIIGHRLEPLTSLPKQNTSSTRAVRIGMDGTVEVVNSPSLKELRKIIPTPPPKELLASLPKVNTLTRSVRIGMDGAVEVVNSQSLKELKKIIPASPPESAEISALRTRRRLSLKQHESRRKLNALLQSHSYFDSEKTKELRKKRNQAQHRAQNRMLNMFPLGSQHARTASSLSTSVSTNPSSSTGKMSYQDIEERLHQLEKENEKQKAELLHSNDELKSVRNKMGNRIVQLQEELESAVATRQIDLIEYATDDDAGVDVKSDFDARSKDSDIRSRDSALSDVIDDLQHQVEDLKEEKTKQKASFETELHETRIEAEQAREQREEAQVSLTRLQEESANLQQRQERQHVRFASTTQLWKHRADGLMEQVREMHLTLQDQTQMRMAERIDFIRLIALLEKENEALKANQQRLRLGSNRSHFFQSRGTGLLGSFRNLSQSLLVLGRTSVPLKNANGEVTWHPTRSIKRKKKSPATSFSLRNVFARGTHFLSSEVFRTAAWSLGVLGLVFISDSSSNFQSNSRLFLQYELVSPFQT